MSVKRSSTATRSSLGGDGAKIERQDLYDHLKRLSAAGQVFTPVDVALAIGAGEPQVSRALLGLAAEGVLQKVELGKYRVQEQFAEIGVADFIKMYSRVSKSDVGRQRDLSEIQRLKQNNDIMRARLLQAVAERDHYLGVLKQHGIDPGPAPAPAANGAVVVGAESADAPAAPAGQEV